MGDTFGYLLRRQLTDQSSSAVTDEDYIAQAAPLYEFDNGLRVVR